nr:unnamed protein product [Digitaria exilis]
MSGGVAGGKGAAAPVPAGSRKLVQSLKEIVNRPEAEIYAALRECGMDPDEAVSRLLSQDTFQEVKSKRDKKKEIKEVPEPRSRSHTSTSRGVRGGADRGGRSNSVHSSSTDNAAARPPISGPPAASINSNQKQTIASGSSVNKHTVADGPAVPLQTSSGSQHGWSGTPGQLSMADIVKMGRPQGKASSKPVVTADRGYAGQYPSLPSAVNQNIKQSGSTVPPADLDKGLPPAQDSVQVQNHGHSAADIKHAYDGGEWPPQDEPASSNHLPLPETSGHPSLYEASLQSSTFVADTVNSHENSHLDENIGMRPASDSERHLEYSEGISQYNDGMSYQPQQYSYMQHEGEWRSRTNFEDSSADVSAAAANFQSLSLHNEELAAKKTAEDNPAVIIPDHLQVTNTECVSLSFGSFGSGAFSGLLPQKTTDNNVELPVQEESTPVDQIDARNQDYYESGAVNSSAEENLETMMGANMENVNAPSVSQANEHRPEALDPSGLQYDMPTFTLKIHILIKVALQANPLSTSSLLGSNQNHSTLHGLEFDLQPYMEPKYTTGSTTNPRPAISMQENTGSASTLGFDEALNRQYKDTSQYMALQQGDNSAMWLHGSGSRATSALAPGHFYGFQGQSQLGGFRQAQQPQPSQFGGHGYPTFYQSQGGLAQEHPQNLAEGSLNGFPAAPSQQSHQSWQHQHTY